MIMHAPLEVSDAAFTPELIETLVQTLKKSKQKLQVFSAAYSGKRKAPIDAAFLAEKTGLSTKRVTEIATGFARKGFLTQLKNHSAKYNRILRISEERHKIIRQATNPATAAKHITMRNPKKSTIPFRTLHIPSPLKAKISQITINNISEFKKIKNIKNSNVDLSTKPLSEKKFKLGLGKLLPGTDLFKDWGGERNDLFGQHITLNGKRVTAAFALKGPFAKPPLTPGKMGKNGDQIQRLVMQASAKLFLVQYEGPIDASVYEQLELLVRAKATMIGSNLYYCIIDHMDSLKLRLAYPKFFR